MMSRDESCTVELLPLQVHGSCSVTACLGTGCRVCVLPSAPNKQRVAPALSIWGTGTGRLCRSSLGVVSQGSVAVEGVSK